MVNFPRLLLLPLFLSCMIAAAPAPVAGPAPGPQPAYASQPSVGIDVVSATYGANCGAVRGNVTPHLGSMCGGQQTCSYRIDATLIGDPAYGCKKDYVAEWRCPGSPEVFRKAAQAEAGYGTVIELACITGGGATPAPPPSAAGGAISIMGATYGLNCGAARGNVTPQLAQSCNGQSVCTYSINYKILGDPAYGCRKDYTAEWTCGANPRVYRASVRAEAGMGSTVEIRCR
jgi:hypothetical protein